MTFDIPLDQPLDVRSHGYINRTRENPMEIPLWASHVSKFSYFPFIYFHFPCKFIMPKCDSVNETTSRFTEYGSSLYQIIMAGCRIFDVIKQLPTLKECDMMDCLPSRWWHNLSMGDNPSYHTLTKLIIFY
jgi:hypothetical protein